MYAVEGVALLAALDSGVDDIAVDLISDLSPDTLAVLAIAFGYTVLHAWRDLAVLAEADPDDYIAARLARDGTELAT